MTRWLALVVVVVTLSTSSVAQADLANNEGIREHVDAILIGVEPNRLDPARVRALLANRLTLNLAVIVPIYGSYKLEHKVFGSMRPAGIVVDWILGGLVPVGLAATALAGSSALSDRTRAILGWTALGLYTATRIGILVVANHHISEYNRLVRLRLGLASPVSGDFAPTVIAVVPW